MIEYLLIMNIFGVGLPEITVILVLALLIFGPKKLTEIGHKVVGVITSKSADEDTLDQNDFISGLSSSSSMR